MYQVFELVAVLLSIDLLFRQVLCLVGEKAELLGGGLRKERFWLGPMDKISCVACSYMERSYLMACLLRKALSLAVHGLMILSEGETYVWFRLGRFSA